MPFFRSIPLRRIISIVNLLVGLAIIFGTSAWHSTTSQRFISDHLQIPFLWEIIGSLFILSAVLLIPDNAQSSDYGYRLGAFLYIIYSVALIVTLRGDRAANIPASGAMIICAGAHLAAGRLAIFDREGLGR